MDRLNIAFVSQYGFWVCLAFAFVWCWGCLLRWSFTGWIQRLKYIIHVVFPLLWIVEIEVQRSNCSNASSRQICIRNDCLLSSRENLDVANILNQITLPAIPARSIMLNKITKGHLFVFPFTAKEWAIETTPPLVRLYSRTISRNSDKTVTNLDLTTKDNVTRDFSRTCKTFGLYCGFISEWYKH